MKKIVASVGLVALGASSLYADNLLSESSKPWSASLTLRGFYDDNVNSTPVAQDSFGFEVSPALFFSYPWEQTTLDLSYVYSFKYYDNRPLGNLENYDQTQAFNLGLTHVFSPRTSLSVRDSFVIGQEPDMLRAGNTYDTFQRIPGDNIRNYGSITLAGLLTRRLGYEVGYENTFFDYSNTGYTTPTPFLGPVQPSFAGVLNRLDNAVHLDAHWQVLPQTIGVLGGEFRNTQYTADEYISGVSLTPFGPVVNGGPNNPAFKSDVRDVNAAYGYVGVNQTFNPDLTASARVGARYSDYYNNPYDQNGLSPYAMANLRYTYAQKSYVEAGLTYDLSTTDAFSVDNSGILLNYETFSIYAMLNHQITRKLVGSVIGQFQDSTYNGGPNSGTCDLYYVVTLNLKYQWNRYLATELGYDFDYLQSQLNNSFHRNRVYIGVTASY